MIIQKKSNLSILFIWWRIKYFAKINGSIGFFKIFIKDDNTINEAKNF